MKKVLLFLIIVVILLVSTNLYTLTLLNNTSIEYDYDTTEIEDDIVNVVITESPEDIDNSLDAFTTDFEFKSLENIYVFPHKQLEHANFNAKLCTINSMYDNYFGEDNISISDYNDEFIKVKIEGFIPKWMIKESESDDLDPVNNRLMYIINDCETKSIPDEASAHAFLGIKGTLVEIIGEYDDWSYVKLNYKWESLDHDYGWIKKSNLGYYEDFDNELGIDVRIKFASTITVYGIDAPVKVTNNNTWGKIYGEDDDKYILLLLGASEAYVNKSDVDPFIIGND